MKNITIGKYRGLQQCSTSRKAISVLALDHRSNLRNSLKPEDPKSVADEEMISFKRDVLTTVASASSAVLLDPEFGLAQSIHSGSLPGNVGLLATLEETGYSGNPTNRNSKLLPGWNVGKAKWMGANAVKLLVYYHPEALTADEIEKLVSSVAEDCKKYDIAFFLEILTYSLNAKNNKLTPEERRRIVIESARKLSPLGVDILKVEFPLDISAEENETIWATACSELSRASVIPWVLLSASVSFENYFKQTIIACQQGATGVAVGRAVWQEATTVKGESRVNLLQSVVHERMTRITEICNALARPWTDFYCLPKPSTTWYEQYAKEPAK